MPTTRKKSAETLIAEMAGWPADWDCDEELLPLGVGLISEFKPFVVFLASSDLAPVTIKRHMDNLWMLGEKIIRDADDSPEDLETSPRELLENAIEGGEGPLVGFVLGELDEAVQKEFERTTRKLAKFRGMDIYQ